MNLYIHIPFCESKCKYCRFASIKKIDTLLINKYVKHLIDDINNKRPVFIQTGLSLDTIYFGGGTPSILSISQIQEILKAIKNNFKITKNTEITLETTPYNIDKQKLDDLCNIGINRLSFGIQTFNNKSLKEIGRGEVKDIYNFLKLVCNSSFENISVDFILGLPYVEKNETKNNIEFVIKNYPKIKHISLYMLEDYYNSEEIVENKYDNIVYPNNWSNLGLSDEEIIDEYNIISSLLKKKDFKRYEISNFSKKNYECKHNMGYWNHDNVIAFGLGSHGFLNNTRYAFPSDFLKYYSGEYEYIEKLQENHILLEKVMFQIRTNGLSYDIVSKLNNTKIKELINNKYLDYIDNRLAVSNKGIGLINFIISEII